MTITKKFSDPESATVVLEFAVSATVFIVASLTLIDLALGLVRASLLEYSLARAARSAIVQSGDPTNIRLARLREAVADHVSLLGLSSDRLEISVCPGLETGCVINDPAPPGELFTISAMVPIFSFIRTEHRYKAVVSMQNEAL
jgi:hypothetical protein